jgi:hypothetical protein
MFPLNPYREIVSPTSLPTTGRLDVFCLGPAGTYGLIYGDSPSWRDCGPSEVGGKAVRERSDAGSRCEE